PHVSTTHPRYMSIFTSRKEAALSTRTRRKHKSTARLTPVNRPPGGFAKRRHGRSLIPLGGIREDRKRRLFVYAALFLLLLVAAPTAQAQVASPEDVSFYTAECKAYGVPVYQMLGGK